jgi:menaquinol-cytochrome c reductase iron-sulfur subunit
MGKIVRPDSEDRDDREEVRATPTAPADPARRDMLWGFLAAATGLVVGLFPLGAGLMVFLDPLRGKKRVPASVPDGGSEFLKIATLDAVPDDGIPRRFPVIADLTDAWNFSPGQPVGAVYVRREQGKKEVQVFHATCPHAGCSVAYSHDADPKNRLYKCPCHNSAFDLEGEKVNLPGKENPSPRPMDTLEVDEQKLASGEVWVKFLNFYTGIHEKKAKP